MSKKTKLNRRQLEALVRRKLQEKLNLQEDVGSAIKPPPPPPGVENEEEIPPAKVEDRKGRYHDPIPRNQSMQETQLNEFLGDLGQDLMDRYYGTGNYGGGTIHGKPWREVAATMARTGGYSKRDDEIAPANRNDIREAETPDLDDLDDMGDAVKDVGAVDMPDLDDMGNAVKDLTESPVAASSKPAADVAAQTAPASQWREPEVTYRERTALPGEELGYGESWEDEEGITHTTANLSGIEFVQPGVGNTDEEMAARAARMDRAREMAKRTQTSDPESLEADEVAWPTSPTHESVSDKEWYDNQLFESLKKKWAK